MFTTEELKELGKGPSTCENPIEVVRKFVWDHPQLTRMATLNALVIDHGVNFNTAATQYNVWACK